MQKYKDIRFKIVRLIEYDSSTQDIYKICNEKNNIQNHILSTIFHKKRDMTMKGYDEHEKVVLSYNYNKSMLDYFTLFKEFNKIENRIKYKDVIHTKVLKIFCYDIAFYITRFL